jgi:hypothetical protein
VDARAATAAAKASTESEIESFTTFVHQQVAALFVDTEPFHADQRPKSSLAACRAAAVTNASLSPRWFDDLWHQHYRRESSWRLHRRVLKGTSRRSASMQSTVELINRKTAQALESFSTFCSGGRSNRVAYAEAV